MRSCDLNFHNLLRQPGFSFQQVDERICRYLLKNPSGVCAARRVYKTSRKRIQFTFVSALSKRLDRYRFFFHTASTWYIYKSVVLRRSSLKEESEACMHKLCTRNSQNFNWKKKKEKREKKNREKRENKYPKRKASPLVNIAKRHHAREGEKKNSERQVLCKYSGLCFGNVSLVEAWEMQRADVIDESEHEW